MEKITRMCQEFICLNQVPFCLALLVTPHVIEVGLHARIVIVIIPTADAVGVFGVLRSSPFALVVLLIQERAWFLSFSGF